MQRKPTNILLLIPTFADEGGTQKMVYELGALLAERYKVYECSFDAGNEPHIFKSGNEVLSLSSPAAPGVFGKLKSYRQKAQRLRRLKEQYAIDVTISNLWAADLVSGLSGGRDKKVSIGHVNIRGNFQNRLLYRLRRLAAAVYARFDRIVAVNQYLRDELAELFRLTKTQAVFINNFLVLPEGATMDIPAAAAGRARLVTFGRLNAIKNHRPLIQVFANLLKDGVAAELVVIGAGPLEAELKDFSRRLGLRMGSEPGDDADIIFTGFHPDPHAVLLSSDLFVFASRSEGFGLVLVEALHAGLPVITSDCPTGGPHMIMEGTGQYAPGRREPEGTPYGYLMPIPETDAPETIAHWQHIIAASIANGEERKVQGKRARERAQAFSKERIKAQWFELIEGL